MGTQGVEGMHARTRSEGNVGVNQGSIGSWERAGILTIKRYLAVLVGEGNGNPLQYSCLENLMDGGAWWAAVHGVAKGQT